MDPNFFKRPIAVTDLEMTGLNPDVHEIIEIGLVVVNQETWEIADMLDVKVKPEHPETANSAALKINGYRAEDWQDAVPLKEALKQYVSKTKGAVFCAHNVAFDWAFLDKAFRKTGVKHEMDYHQIDTASIAWAKLRNTGIGMVRLSALCRYFGIPEEPAQHRAINGARVAYEVLKHIVNIGKGE